VRILRLLGDEGNARRDECVVLRQHDADTGILLGAAERVRTENAVADQMLAGADALHHRARAGIETRAGLAELTKEIPRVRPVLDVLVHKKKADARALG